MKSIYFLLFIACAIQIGFAQSGDVSETIPVNVSEIQMEFEYANVVLKSWDKKEIKITGSIVINRGENNANFSIEHRTQSGRLYLNTDIKDIENLPHLIIAVKDGKKMYLGKTKGKGMGNWNSWKGDDWKKKFTEEAEGLEDYDFDHVTVGPEIDVRLEIFVPKNIEVEVHSTYGDLTVDNVNTTMDIQNTYGHIDAYFTGSKLPAMTLHSVYSHVDVSFPESAKANIYLQTNYGDIYSDLDLDYDVSGGTSEAFNTKIKASYNGGGPVVKLKATYDNVYLRKS